MIIINDVIDEYLVKDNESKFGKFKREVGRFWPTDCSCKVNNKVMGKCARALYYSMNNVSSTNPINSRGLRICDAGNMYENKEIERVKEIKFYVDHAYKIKFMVPDTNITIAGKLDYIINIDGKNIGVEKKSGYGYNFNKQISNTPTCPGLPIIKHLMQVMMYLYYFKYIDKKMNIDEFYISYEDRGNCESTQFGVKLTDDDYPIIESTNGEIYVMKDINLNNPNLFNQNPKNKREINKLNNMCSVMKDYEISVNNIFDRFKYTLDFVKRKELPPKDFKYVYSDEYIEELHNTKQMSTQKYNKIKKYNTIERDFECTYCNYLKNCIKDDTHYTFKE